MTDSPRWVIGVLGLGYVGLPLVRACVNAGHSVVGFDVSERVVKGLSEGHSHVDDVEPRELDLWLEAGFLPTTNPTALHNADVFVICVPTPLSDSGGPDLAAVEAATKVVRDNLRPGCLVVLESTTYPGTTEEVVGPILEESGLIAGVDFSLAFSPERIDPGNQRFGFENTPKVVGGLTAMCTEKAVRFYMTITLEVVPVRGLKEAEMAKLVENTYRHVNIALMNELAQFCHEMGIDIWEVIRAAETKPFGFQSFRPGPGVGGHCIPIDPNYLGHRVRDQLGRAFRFVELAQEINSGMPSYVVDRVEEILSRQGIALPTAHVYILGVAYKANISDTRETPAAEVVRALRRSGAVVSFHDSLVRNWSVDDQPVQRIDDWVAGVVASDCTVLLQAHAEYQAIADGTLDATVLDTRGVSPRGAYERL